MALPLFGPGSPWGAAPLAACALALVLAVLTARIGRTRARQCKGALLVGAASLVLGTQPPSALSILAAIPLGVGAGVLVPSGWLTRRAVYASSVAALLVMLAVALVGSGANVLWLASLAAVVVAIATPGEPRSSARGGILILGASWTLALGLLAFIGASDTTVSWFGPVVRHGPRSASSVALTFDDGPDEVFTLKVAAILEQFGVRGAFFSVGKAVDRAPSITRELAARGHLIGNHSYEHDQWRWLDPRYPELARAQRAIDRAANVCPTFYRPPHGQRTPFLLRAVRDRQMTTVLWDVSAGDWHAHDATQLAATILKKVRPGSIIDLHDGLDGNPGADRSVLVDALPLILDGLRAKGLSVVRLDELLHRAPYAGRC